MPLIGLGTFNILNEGDKKTIQEVLTKAILEEGYRHIDCAKVYHNEAEIGEILAVLFKAG